MAARGREESETTLAGHNSRPTSHEKPLELNPPSMSENTVAPTYGVDSSTTPHSQSDPYSRNNHDEQPLLPPLPVNLLDYKRPIAISLTILVVSSCFIPLILYYSLKYGANSPAPVYLGVSTASFGVSSLFNYFTRLYRLAVRKPQKTGKPNVQPLHARSRKSLDFFQWDFTLGFIIITAIIVCSVSLKPRTKLAIDRDTGSLPRLTSMSLIIFLYYITLQLVLVNLAVIGKVRNPFRVSSVPKGDPARPALYTIIEDVIAVDGDFGLHFREAWNARYLASPRGMMRKLLLDVSWIWGFSGLGISALLTGLIFSPSVTSHDVAWTIGWTVPWVWLALMALWTIWFVRRRVAKEHEVAAATAAGTRGTMRTL